MKAAIDEDLCTACGTCPEVCPEVFELPDDAEVARVKVDEVPSALVAKAREAAEECPVDAISIEE
ncbi:MAG: ferredoxin [Planctomycetota bacterium]